MRTLQVALFATSALALAGCEMLNTEAAAPEAAPAAETEEAVEVVVETVVEEVEVVVEEVVEVEVEAEAPSSADRLAKVLAAQPEEVQARYGARHPAETLAFFGIEPGMTVVEALPGGGWYSKILLAHLGPDGKLIGAQYPNDIWGKVLPDASEERLAGFIERADGWADTAAAWEVPNAAKIGNVSMPDLGDEDAGQVDAILFIRALHNLNRVNSDTGYFTSTIAGSYERLAPGGIVGVVQHKAPENVVEEWADGNAGYLREDYVVAAFEAAGFVLEASSDINANPKDQPSEEDFVWRLPPTLASTEEGTPEREAMVAIGESNRMTLLFRKPAD